MWKMMLPKRRHIFIMVAIWIVIGGLVFFTLASSDAYEYAKNFVRRDDRILKITGLQKAQNLDLSSDNNETVGDVTGEASYTIRVEGGNGNFVVPLALKKVHGSWQVVSAKVINGQGRATIIVE